MTTEYDMRLLLSIRTSSCPGNIATHEDVGDILRMIKDGDLIHVDHIGAHLRREKEAGNDLPEGVTLYPERGPFRKSIEALDIGGRHFEPLPDGMAIKLHQRRCSARKALAQVDGMRWTTLRGERDGAPGVWIERVE